MKYERMPPKQASLRDMRIKELAVKSMSSDSIYEQLFFERLLELPSGRHQSRSWVGRLICECRERVGIRNYNIKRIIKFQRLKMIGFRRRRIMSIMNLTGGQYHHLNQNYWTHKEFFSRPEAQVALNSRIVVKALKMHRLGYTSCKVKEHMGISNSQYRYVTDSLKTKL